MHDSDMSEFITFSTKHTSTYSTLYGYTWAGLCQ